MEACPNCGSHELLVYEMTTYKLNTGDFFCHSVKMHDKDAECRCIDCDWRGTREDLSDAARAAGRQ